MSHRSDVLSNRINYNKYTKSGYESEVRAYGKNIRHEGIYGEHGFDFVSEINRTGSNAGNMLYLQDTPWAPTPFQSFIYRIPRRW